MQQWATEPNYCESFEFFSFVRWRRGNKPLYTHKANEIKRFISSLMGFRHEMMIDSVNLDFDVIASLIP